MAPERRLDWRDAEAFQEHSQEFLEGPFRAILSPMRTFLHRLLGFARARGFDAAAGGRRWEGARTVDGLNAAILAGATTAARRAGWYARNNPWVAAAVDSLVGNVVGAGIKPQSTHPDRAGRGSERASSSMPPVAGSPTGCCPPACAS